MVGNRIVLVGGQMYLGRLLRETLPLRGFDVRAVDGVATGHPTECPCCSLEDVDALADAFAGAAAVIDLSKLDSRRWGGDYAKAVRSLEGLWEAARRSRVRRVAMLVPDGVVGLYRRSAVLDSLSPARPDGADGVVGAIAESMASLFAYKHAISAMCIRMGACRPEPLDERMLATWIAPTDFVELIVTALTADYSFEVVYGVSRNTSGWWDNSNAHRLGYRPRHRSDDFADALRGNRSSNAIENVLQGGARAAADFTGDLRRIP